MKKQKVLLVCSAGMSTDFLVQKLKKAIAEKNVNYDFSACPLNTTNFRDLIKGFDVLLLAPQVRYRIDEVQALTKELKIPMESIPFQIYGLCDTEKIIAMVDRLLKLEE